MTRTMNRRSLLASIGVAATAGVAGCSGDGTRTDETPGTEQESTRQEATATTERTSTEETAFVEDTPSELLYDATGLDGDLLYVEAASAEYAEKRAVFDGETTPFFDSIGNFHVGDEGLIYVASEGRGPDGETVLMVGGEELTRTAGALFFEDVADGVPVWRTDEERSVFYHGEDRIETEHRTLHGVEYIDDSFAYTGTVQIDQGQFQGQVVHGGEVIDEGGLFRNLTELDGTPMYSAAKGNGEYVAIGDRTVGGEFTRLSGGAIEEVAALDGKPMFVATVHPDEQVYPDLTEEKVLWFDGEEIGRYRGVLYAEVVGGQLAYVYSPAEEERLSCRHGGQEVGAEYENVSEIADIDGNLAYRVELPDDRVEGENDNAVVYQDAESDAYRQVDDIFEVDGSATFLARTGTGYDSNVLVRET